MLRRGLARGLQPTAAMGKRVRQCAVALLVMEAIYVIGGNLFLAYGLTRLTNFEPDLLEMQVDHPFTLWPGRAHVRHYRLRSQDTVIQWVLDVEDADLTVDLLDLFKRKFHATHIRAKKTSFRLRRKLDDFGARSERALALPPIPGYASPPMKDIGPPGPPLSDADYNLWSAELEDVTSGLSEVWIDELQLRGPATVTGGFYFKPERFIRVGPVSLVVNAGELRMDARAALRDIEGIVDATVGVIDLRGPLPEAVRQISGGAQIEAELADVDFVGIYLPHDFPVQFDHGGGAVHLSLLLSHGVMLPPTWVRVESEGLAVTGKELGAVMSVVTEAQVEPHPEGPAASCEIRVRDAVLHWPGSELAPPVIDAARVRFSRLSHDLAEPMQVPDTHLEAAATVPDLAVFVPRPDEGRTPPVSLGGAAALHAEADVDGDLRGGGRVEIRSDGVTVTTRALAAAARLDAAAAFDGVDLAHRDLHLLPSYVALDDVTVTREGRAHAGGSVRVNVNAGALRSGEPRDLELALSARFPDLRWLSFGKGSGAFGVTARAGAVEAKLAAPRPAAVFDRSLQDAAVTGSVDVLASGGATFRDVAVRGRVHATTVIERLHLGRPSIRVRDTRIAVRDTEIERGDSRSAGWWGTFDVSSLEGTAGDAGTLHAHVNARCQSGKPFLAVLASAGMIPGWAASLFPMNDLHAVADVRRERGAVRLGLSAGSSSANVRARLQNVGASTKGAILVETALASVGVELTGGESHVHVFAGEDWFAEKVAQR